jgi:hypothetical protein
MNTQRIMQKFIRRLHRNLFHRVPNDGPHEVDLSRLQPARRDLPVFALQFSQATEANSSQGFIPEPWDAKN